MDIWTSIAVSAILEVLKNRKDWVRNLDKLAKLYWKLDQLVQSQPEIAAAVEKQRSK